HHALSQRSRRLVHFFSACANQLVVFPCHRCPQRGLRRLNRTALVLRHFPRRFSIKSNQRFGGRLQHDFTFLPRVDQLPLGEILRGEINRFLQHALDLGVIKAVTRLDLEQLL